MQGIEGMIIAVTGASGGVGAAVCDDLRSRGAVVYALDLRIPPSGASHFISTDVRDPDSMAVACTTVLEAEGRVDGLVAAAGLSEEPTPAEEMSSVVWQLTLGVNLTGAFNSVQAFARPMLERRQGRVVVIGSMSGNHIVNRPQQQVAYNASKAGVMAMVRSLAAEWVGRGIRVNALSPGYIDTPLLASKSSMHETWRREIPAGRFATAHETAQATAFLLSDEAEYFCGSELLMDGGYSLW